jgi:hypothetical protein
MRQRKGAGTGAPPLPIRIEILVFIELLSAPPLVLLSLAASQRLRQALLEALAGADTASVHQHPIDCEIAPQQPAAYLASVSRSPKGTIVFGTRSPEDSLGIPVDKRFVS